MRITGTGQLLSLNRRLRAAGHEHIRQSMIRRFRYAGEQVAEDLRREVRSLSIRGTGSTRSGRGMRTSPPLRPEIAAAIRVSVRTGTFPGARIWLDRSRMSAGRENLPARTNEGRWRHPVFGNRRVWTTSTSRPWWEPTIRRNEQKMRDAAQLVLDDIERRLRG